MVPAEIASEIGVNVMAKPDEVLLLTDTEQACD
jgi:hypothetical protein